MADFISAPRPVYVVNGRDDADVIALALSTSLGAADSCRCFPSPGATLAGEPCHTDEGEAQMFPAALPSFIDSLPVFTTVWYDLTPCTQHRRSLVPWRLPPTSNWGMSGPSDADCGCQILLFFCLPTQLTALFNDLTFAWKCSIYIHYITWTICNFTDVADVNSVKPPVRFPLVSPSGIERRDVTHS